MTIKDIPDISFYQDDNETPQGVNFVKMKTKADEVIIRAGQRTWIDQDFIHNWLAAKKAGLGRGSYWYYDSRTEPEAQARLWAKALGDDLGELPLHVDLEEKYGGRWSGYSKWMSFVKYVQRHIPNKKIVIYTSPGYWNEFGPSDRYNAKVSAFFGQFPLWIAHYGVDKPLMPKNTWKKAILHQYTMTGDGRSYGTESLGIDLNRFIGNDEDLQWYLGNVSNVSPPIPEPPIIVDEPADEPDVPPTIPDVPDTNGDNDMELVDAVNNLTTAINNLADSGGYVPPVDGKDKPSVKPEKIMRTIKPRWWNGSFPVYRTPDINANKVSKIRLVLVPGQQVEEREPPKRIHNSFVWDTEKDLHNLQRNWVWLPQQNVILDANKKMVELPTWHIQDWDVIWHGVFIETKYLLEKEN